MSATEDPFIRPDPEQARRARAHEALFRVTERHATGQARLLWEQSRMPMSAHEAIRRVSDLAAGSAAPDPDAPAVDQADLTAALTLVPLARAEFDQMEVGLLTMAKGRGMTWQELAYGLGLNTAQAARQRHDRLQARTET
ncbi:DNA-binding protein [Nocardiopsis sp. MG754419]|uniref:DNA-binding protein n=1 Tax=Nocardiopsis sp. MG754419 TaxID=2259865 RepID=UPI001BAC2957|nr:DNA-binding protein [Nocardiopsis sp. MG754419]MBR8744573.1 DNA-binding protein [Nocardiopsis sp. MG754419]